MNVGVLCEYSGRVRDAFTARGHTAMSCDLLPSETEGRHIQGDVRGRYWDHFDLLVCHPPCTYLSNSGVRWLHTQEGRKEKMEEASKLFKWMMDLPVPKICIENPIMHKYAVEIIGRRQDQIIQPWQYGEDASKATCLWLKGLPPLVPTNIIQPNSNGRYSNQTPSGQNNLGPSADRAKARSLTYTGIALAMAEQWG